jgi:Protein of unknown function (DUF4012)
LTRYVFCRASKAEEGDVLAEPVLLVSSDPFLGSSLEALARGRLLVSPVDPAHRPSTWPGEAACTVVLDLGTEARAAAYPWVRQHHDGRLVVLLQPGERESGLPADPDQLALHRPFRLADLVEILVGTAPTTAPSASSPAAPVGRSTAGREPARSNRLPVTVEQRGRQPESQPVGADPASASAPAAAAVRPKIQPTPSAKPAARAAMPAARPTVPADPPPQPASPAWPVPVPAGAKPATRWAAIAAKIEAAGQAVAAWRAARAASRATQAPDRPVARRSPPIPLAPVPSRPGVRHRLGAASRHPAVTLAVLGGMLGVLIAGGWLAFGLLQAREDLRVAAAGFRTELTEAEQALRRGDPDAATAALRAAARDLAAAEAVTGRRPMRVAARLPLLSGGVSDVDHLLAAAWNLTRAGDQAVAVSSHLQSGRFAVLQRGRFDLDALGNAADQAKGLVAELDQVRAELAQVHGGPFAPGSDQTKRWALERLDQAVARARPVASTLAALPPALGADHPRTYLIVLSSPAELRPGGGVPLAVIEAELRKGVVEVRTRDGAIAENVHNAQATWTAVPGDPWARGGRFTEFSLANSSPNFPTAGEELVRAYAARGRLKPDGVIAIDPLAMRALLQATGPVTTPGYGQLTAINCVRQTTHDAYVRWPSRAQRRRYNEALLGTLLGRMLSGRDLVTTGKVLGASGGRRQMQIYVTDPTLQQVLAGNGMAGGLSPAQQDYLAVHTLNTSHSRMDYFQRRSVHQLVQLRPDGSAEVTRTIDVANLVPPSEPVQDGAQTGYNSGRAAAVLANYLPSGATVEEATLNSRPVRPSVAHEGGRPLLRVDIDLAPGQSASFTVRYLTPKAAVTKHGFAYRFTADPQVMVRPPMLRVDVVAPPGMSIAPAPGWAVKDATATVRQPFTDPIDTSLDLRG